MHAMMRIVPPQPAQTSISIPNTRIRHCAQRIVALGRRSHIGPRNPFPALIPPGPGDQCAVRTVVGEHTVVAGEIHPWPGHQRGQSHQKIQRLEHKVCGAVVVPRFELVAHFATGSERQALLR
jgi:hypothetical protein